MKLLIVLFISGFSLFSHASYYATHCSNSTGSIKWETGHNSNTITFKNYGSDGTDVSLSYYNVSIKMGSEHVLRNENIRRCGYAAFTRVYAGKAVITPAEDHPEALDFLGTDQKLETEVICTHHMNSRAPCP